jgi:cytochrome c biogenesis protein CcmG, thiol:disulfide interchange protein DsbE
MVAMSNRIDGEDAAGERLPDERPWRRREYSGAGSTLGVAMLIVLAVGLAVWYFELRGEPGPGGDASGGIIALPEELNPTGREPVAEVGRAAPNFALETLDGETLTLSDYRGTPVVLNFWASWCGPCRQETPALQQFAEENPGVQVIGINQQEQPGQARDFAEEFGVTYPIPLDQTGAVSQGFRVNRGLPVTFFISADGIIDAVHYSVVTTEDLQEYADGLVRR